MPPLNYKNAAPPELKGRNNITSTRMSLLRSSDVENKMIHEICSSEVQGH